MCDKIKRMVRYSSPQVSHVRVRFPPSPTGIPHLGNTRTALFNFLFARHNNGKFILRIEDTDRSRLVKGAEDKIKEILNWLDLSWDEFYRQSERLPLYKEKANELIKKGVARKDEGAVRFIIPKGKKISWEDAIGNKKISFKSDDIEDFIILKSDGYPTYHLASVVDDSDMKISHVIRGDEWISSTPKHILLYEALGWQHPIFAHLPVILGPDHTKLSKRHGAESVLDLRDKGFLKEAIINFMALLGWNPGGDREIMGISEMIKLFDLQDINTGSPIFDIKKLEWMNGEYIRKTQNSKLKSQILEFDPKIAQIEKFEQYIPLAKTRMKTLADFRVLVENQKDASLNERQKKLAQELVNAYRKLPEWKSALISTATIGVRDQIGASTQDVYAVLTGRPQGLPFEQKLEIQGQAGTISWLEGVLKR